MDRKMQNNQSNKPKQNKRSDQGSRNNQKSRSSQGSRSGPSNRNKQSGQHNQNKGKQINRNSHANRTDRRAPRRKRKSGGVFSTILLIIALGVFVFSGYQLTTMLLPYFTGGREYSEIRAQAITILTEEELAELVEEEAETGTANDGIPLPPRWIPPLRVDFEALWEINPRTVAWIFFVEPEIINYPVVLSQDNEEYLHRTFTGEWNPVGAIFMDMKNNPNFEDRNTIIYGHNMQDRSMFARLMEFEDREFFEENPYFYIFTPDGMVRTYQIFSAKVVYQSAPQYQIEFFSDEQFLEYLEMCVLESLHQREGINLSEDDLIVSLSTCTNIRQVDRFLVQGVLVDIRPAR